MTWLPKFLRNPKYDAPTVATTRELIKRESEIGSNLFGYLAPNRRREFFCLDAKTWVWHEEWQDHRGAHQVTTRYEIHGNNVLKLQGDAQAELVRGEELTNLYNAAKSYYIASAAQVYNRPVA